MKLFRFCVSLVFVIGLVACDEPLPDSGGDVSGEADTGNGGGDDSSQGESDTDDPGDTGGVDEDPGDTTVPEPDDDADPDADDASDVEDEPEEDVGTSCATDREACEEPFTCIEGVCRVSLGGTAWAESSFVVEEPSEVTRLFNLFKSFSSDTVFLLLDIQPGYNRLVSRVGSADVIDVEAEPKVVSYQYGDFMDPFEPGSVIFMPLVEEERPLDGRGWTTDPFSYSMRATSLIDFGNGEPFYGTFGLDAENVVLTVRTLEGDGTITTALLEGYVTRAETESRFMIRPEDFAAFNTLFCNRSNQSYHPGEVWKLSDLLDCNDAVMDVDSDDDGEPDSYRVRISAKLEPVVVED